MLRPVGAFHRHAEVVRLFLGELGELHADAFEVQAGDLFFGPIEGSSNSAALVARAEVEMARLAESGFRLRKVSPIQSGQGRGR